MNAAESAEISYFILVKGYFTHYFYPELTFFLASWRLCGEEPFFSAVDILT